MSNWIPRVPVDLFEDTDEVSTEPPGLRSRARREREAGSDGDVVTVTTLEESTPPRRLEGGAAITEQDAKDDTLEVAEATEEAPEMPRRL
mmetsp:Transcript_21192/g.37530  ORF Transcript_21192/g.37530 Transcript_21192/m.37530 type:complete len:90 (+) Transcript_21192:512-781(+)